MLHASTQISRGSEGIFQRCPVPTAAYSVDKLQVCPAMPSCSNPIGAKYVFCQSQLTYIAAAAFPNYHPWTAPLPSTCILNPDWNNTAVGRTSLTALLLSQCPARFILLQTLQAGLMVCRLRMFRTLGVQLPSWSTPQLPDKR